MPCYHPQLLLYNGINSDTGNPKYKFSRQQVNRKFYNPDGKDVIIPCRKCIGCRLDYSRKWADRLMLELDHSKTALFLTLTYDDAHAHPALYDDNLDTWFYTLYKKDLQDFNKRLRYHFRHKEIRFYAAGEYGSSSLRPHYHGIYFGLELSDFPDLKLLFLNDAKQPIYTSDFLRDIWSHGHISIGNVSWQSCAYVARYNLKKLEHGKDDVSIARNCLPEFSLMSRNPGIGGYFFDDHPEFRDNPTDKFYFCDAFGVKPVDGVYLPNYLFQKLELTNPELCASIKEQRRAFSHDSFLAELAQTDLDEYEYLDVKERVHEKRAKAVHRPPSISL